MNFETYYQKTYAAWLGKLIGIRLGAPVEGWTAAEIRETYGRITGYPVDYGVFAADDDANGPLFFVRSLLTADDPSVEQMADTLAGYIADGHGFFWWGGIGVSTEDTAYHNLRRGIPAPRSGSAEVNGIALAEQIGGQIFSDCWGYVSAGDPALAARLAGRMSSVTHDGDGIHGGVFVAAAIALAYTCRDIREVLRRALSYIPAESGYARCVQDVTALWEQGLSWEACLSTVLERYDYSKYPGVCHIIPNTAIMIAAMLYGQQDFLKTLCLLCEAGWDTDCTLGNVGSILGALVGLEGIPPHLIVPLEDRILASSCMGSLNLDTISGSALRFARLGARLAGMEVPPAYLAPGWRFRVPYGTQGFAARPNRYCELRPLVRDGALQIIVNQAFPHQVGRVFHKTYFTPGEVYDARYQPSFSPTVYPGATLTFTLSGPENLLLRLYAQEVDGPRCTGPAFALTAEPRDYALTIPDGHDNAVIGEIGLLVEATERMSHQRFTLHAVTTDGRVHQQIHWPGVPLEDWGLDFGGSPWRTIRGCTTYAAGAAVTPEGLEIRDDFVIFSDAAASLQRAEVTAQLQWDGDGPGGVEVRFHIRSAVSYFSLRFDRDGCWFCRRTGLRHQEAVSLPPVRFAENGKLRLTFCRKNGSMCIYLSDVCLPLRPIPQAEAHGAFGLAADGCARLLVLRTELECDRPSGFDHIF